MKIMAVDLGQVRTGIAVCDAGEVLASPVTVLRQPNREKLAQEIAALAQTHHAELLVLGHPLNMDGSAGASAQGAELLITACPLCSYNLLHNTDGRLPVVYFTELLAEALGCGEEDA